MQPESRTARPVDAPAENTPVSRVPAPGAVTHPLGPLVYRVRAGNPRAARGYAVLVLSAALAVLSAAAWLTPDPSGHGTHRQLGLPPCSMMLMAGYPCPTCGMTTAFSHTVRGELLSAFSAHPGGLGFALATVATGAVALGVLLTGKVWAVNWYRVTPLRIVVALVVLIVGGWGFKIAVGLMRGVLPATG